MSKVILSAVEHRKQRRTIRRESAYRALASRCNSLRRHNRGGPWKFLYHNFWLRNNLYRIHRLELDHSPPLRVLDLGCGSGLFVYLARFFGHDAIGLSSPPTIEPEEIVFREFPQILGIPLIFQKIVAQKPVLLDAPFDLITSFMTWFHISDNKWTLADWLHFFRHIRNYLKPNGRLVLHLNADPYYGELQYFDEGTRSLFLRIGTFYASEKVFVIPSSNLAAL